jgi:uncharacterized protein YbaR (Trm112 family)/ubiquinone/menaquinone biosynthesis C-methylase UbiE
MHVSLLELLKCPVCPGVLTIVDGAIQQDLLDEGKLKCEQCNAVYRVAEGIPRLVPQSGPSVINAEDIEFFDSGDWEVPKELPDAAMRPHFAANHPRYEYNDRYLFRQLRKSPLKGPMLDLGCGLSDLPWVLMNETESRPRVGIDLAISSLKKSRELNGMEVVQGCMDALPFRDGAFGSILCLGALHHCVRYPEAQAEMLRITQVGGQLAVHEPVLKPSLRGKASKMPSPGCYRFPEKEFFETLLNDTTVVYADRSMTTARIVAHLSHKPWMMKIRGLMPLIAFLDRACEKIGGPFFAALGPAERWYILER